MTEFSDRELARAELAAYLTGNGTTATQDIDLLVEACVDAYRTSRFASGPPGTLSLMFPRFYWVIRDDDLKIFDSFSKAVTAAASSNFLIQSMTAASVVGLLSAIFGVYRQVRTKGITLTIDQCLVLDALRREGPRTVVELARTIALTTDDVASVLTSLGKVLCADGSTVSLVSRDGHERWVAAGV